MLPLDNLRSKLLAHRRQLFIDAARTEDDVLQLEQDPQSEFAEQGQEENLIRLLDRMDARLKAEIESIDRALVRMETGRYGLCSICGREIGSTRLEALPAAEVCLDCAQRQESRSPQGG